MNKLQCLLAVIALGLLEHSEAGFLPRLPNDPDYVQLSPRCSLYVISVDSSKWHRFGLGRGALG